MQFGNVTIEMEMHQFQFLFECHLIAHTDELDDLDELSPQHIKVYSSHIEFKITH